MLFVGFVYDTSGMLISYSVVLNIYLTETMMDAKYKIINIILFVLNDL